MSAPPESAGAPVALRPRRLLAVTSFAHFMNDGIIFFIPVVSDLLIEAHHDSTATVTAMLTVFYLCSAGVGVLVGLLADRVGRRGPLIALGIATLGVSLFGFDAALTASGATSTALAIAAAVVAGVGSSVYHPLGGSIVQLSFSDGARGKALGVNGAFGSLGRALYPALFFVIAGLGLSKGDTALVAGTVALLAAAVIAAGLVSGGADGPRRGRAHATQSVPLRSLLTRSVVALMAISLVRSLAFIGVVSWIPVYLTSSRHAGISTMLGVIVTIMYAGGIIGQLLFGLLADRFDKRAVLALDSLGSAGGIAWFLTTSGHGVAATASLFVFGLFTFSGFPLLLSLVSDYVPRSSSATGNALVWGVGATGGQALGPLVVSVLMGAQVHRLGGAFGAMAVLIALSVLATPLLARTARSNPVQLFG